MIRWEDSPAAKRRDAPIGRNVPAAVAPINFAARRREILLSILTQLLVLRESNKQEDFYFALGVLVNDRLTARSLPGAHEGVAPGAHHAVGAKHVARRLIRHSAFFLH